MRFKMSAEYDSARALVRMAFQNEKKLLSKNRATLYTNAHSNAHRCIRKLFLRDASYALGDALQAAIENSLVQIDQRDIDSSLCSDLRNS
jgi:hypothetical protein